MLANLLASNSQGVRKAVAILGSASLLIASLAGFELPAKAATTFEVVFNGNTIGTAVPANQTQTKDVAFTLPLATDVTGSRTGYSFGGWSLTAGGQALTSPYTYTGDATRLDLYAVWNTTVTYNKNGSTSGSLQGSKTTDPYRFGQTLTLPLAGTLTKASYAFGGWMTSALSTSRITSYTAASNAAGNPTLYAAWIKTVSFNSNGATEGQAPANLVHISGGDRLKLPTISEMTIRKPGYLFMGWSTSSTGSLVSSPNSYLPTGSSQALYAIWKLQSTKANSVVFFLPGKSKLRAFEKLVLNDLIEVLIQSTDVKITLKARRAIGSGKLIGKARNQAVIDYLEANGVKATFEKSVVVGKAGLATAKKNNRVSIAASWAN